MFESMLRTMIPLLLVKVGDVSQAEKRQYAEFLSEVMAAYLTNRKADFCNMLLSVKLPSEMVVQIQEALWRDKSNHNPSK